MDMEQTAGSALENDQIISRQSIIHFAAGRSPEVDVRGFRVVVAATTFWRVPGWRGRQIFRLPSFSVKIIFLI